MSHRHMAVIGGLVAGGVVALIWAIDRNRAVLDAAIDNFALVDVSDLIATPVAGTVTEGDPNDFTVVGTFGEVTKAQKIRNRPTPV